jgi:hypothetical protein
MSFSSSQLTSSAMDTGFFWLQNHILRRSNNRVNVIKPPACGTLALSAVNLFKLPRVPVFRTVPAGSILKNFRTCYENFMPIGEGMRKQWSLNEISPQSCAIFSYKIEKGKVLSNELDGLSSYLKKIVLRVPSFGPWRHYLVRQTHCLHLQDQRVRRASMHYNEYEEPDCTTSQPRRQYST